MGYEEVTPVQTDDNNVHRNSYNIHLNTNLPPSILSSSKLRRSTAKMMLCLYQGDFEQEKDNKSPAEEEKPAVIYKHAADVTGPWLEQNFEWVWETVLGTFERDAQVFNPKL